MLISGTWVLRDPYNPTISEGFLNSDIDEPNISTFSTISSFGDVKTWNGIAVDRDAEYDLPYSLYYYRGNVREIVGSYDFGTRYWGEDDVFNYDRISFGNDVVDIPDSVYNFITSMGFQESKPPYILEFWTPDGATKYPYKTVTQIENLPKPYLQGHNFIGWEYGRLGSGNFAKIGDVILRNTKLYAKFEQLFSPPSVDNSPTTTPFFKTYNAFIIKKSDLDVIWDEGLDTPTLSEIIFGEDTLNYIQNVSVSPFTRKNLLDAGARMIVATPYSLIWKFVLVHASFWSFTHNCPNTFDVCNFKIEEEYKDFRDYSPYSLYELYLPYYGYVKMDIDNIMNKMVNVKISIDYFSGDCTYYLYANEEFVNSWSCNLYLKYPIVRTNVAENVHAMLSNVAKIGTGALARLPALAAGNEMTQALLSASSYHQLTSGLIGVFDTASKTNVEYSAPDGFDKVYMPNVPYLRITKAKTRLYDKEYYGRPCFHSYSLNFLTGYTEVGDIHLENINATQEELDEIVSLLKSGVIF